MANTTVTEQFLVCHTCACIIANGDTSGVEDTDYFHTIESNLAAYGYLVLNGTREQAGYWDCQVCNQTCIGEDANVAEPI